MIRSYFTARPVALRTLAPSILAVLLAGTALAQDASDAAPPTLVGRVSAVEGQVSLLRFGQTDWFQAAINEPISIGDALYANDSSDARIEIGAADLALKADSEIDIAQLDQNTGTLRLDVGTLDLRVGELPTADGLSIATPRGTVRLTQPGIYRIDSGTEDQPTAVTAWNGAAQLGDTAAAVNVQPGQTLLISGTADAPQYSYQTASGGPPSEFRPRPALIAEQHYIPPGMTGGDDLYRYGAFQTVSQYGAVWYPNDVPADWQPYRYGHWENIAPWGLTWIDEQPWGFAPFHYGRWANISGRWGWIPGAYEAHPVYAPALVAFVGGGGGFSAAIAFGGGEAVGWVPLGPGEPYRPYYRASPSYIEQINQTVIVTNDYRPGFGRDQQPANFGGYANARFATVVPANALGGGRPVNSVAIRVKPDVLEHVQVNHQATQQFVASVKPAPIAATHQAARPGPVAPPANPRAAIAARPALLPAGRPGAARPTETPQAARGGQPTPAAPRPEAGKPPAPPVHPEARPEAARPETANPPAARPGARPETHAPSAPRPEAARPSAASPEERPEAARPPVARPEAARPPAPRPEARPETARPPAQQAPPPETAKPSPPRPEARPQAPRPEAAKPPASHPQEAKPPVPAQAHPPQRPTPEENKKKPEEPEQK